MGKRFTMDMHNPLAHLNIKADKKNPGKTKTLYRGLKSASPAQTDRNAEFTWQTQGGIHPLP